MSLKFNLDVRWQSQGVIYAIRPLNGSPGKLSPVGRTGADLIIPLVTKFGSH